MSLVAMGYNRVPGQKVLFARAISRTISRTSRSQDIESLQTNAHPIGTPQWAALPRST